MVTARGSPSGMATTTMVTAMMKAWITPLEIWPPVGLSCSTQIMAISAAKVSAANTVPMYPMSWAMRSSLSCSGVFTGSETSLARILPHWLCAPTAITNMCTSGWRPRSVSVEEEMRKGSPAAAAPFTRGSGSPVSEDSSAFTPSPSASRPSAGTPAPALSTTMSPTSRSSVLTMTSTPPRRTRALSSPRLSFSSARNCFSLV
mmetsp:Transcript_12190/g.19868  ORF Transcript_12190/g.19868 Transcript_12190/m.19868 type:complete len:203 (-) Transcript_12190:544-1152(-)